MSRFDRKDLAGMLWAMLAILVIPISIVVMRPRPLSASSAIELDNLASHARQEEVLTQMVKRYEGMSLNFEGPDLGSDPAVRWQEIQTSLEHAGAEVGEAHKVVQVAQVNLKGAWPCVAERGYLKDRPVWLVVASSPRDTGFLGWICPPSAEDIRRERIDKYCGHIQVAIVSAQAPYLALN